MLTCLPFVQKSRPEHHFIKTKLKIKKKRRKEKIDVNLL